MEEFLKFRKMITPTIIQVLFWVGVVVSVIAGLATMVMSFSDYGGGAGTFFAGLLMLVLGPVMVRVYCELLILFFRMNETLTDIKNGLAKK
jgi:hypothetical protein